MPSVCPIRTFLLVINVSKIKTTTIQAWRCKFKWYFKLKLQLSVENHFLYPWLVVGVLNFFFLGVFLVKEGHHIITSIICVVYSRKEYEKYNWWDCFNAICKKTPPLLILLMSFSWVQITSQAKLKFYKFGPFVNEPSQGTLVNMFLLKRAEPLWTSWVFANWTEP